MNLMNVNGYRCPAANLPERKVSETASDFDSENEFCEKLKVLVDATLNSYIASECTVFQSILQINELLEPAFSSNTFQLVSGPLSNPIKFREKCVSHKISPKPIRFHFNRNEPDLDVSESLCSDGPLQNLSSDALHKLHKKVQGLLALFESRLSTAESIKNGDYSTEDIENCGYLSSLAKIKTELNAKRVYPSNESSRELTGEESGLFTPPPLSSAKPRCKVYPTLQKAEVVKTSKLPVKPVIMLPVAKKPEIVKRRRIPPPAPPPKQVTETFSIDCSDPLIHLPSESSSKLFSETSNNSICENINIPSNRSHSFSIEVHKRHAPQSILWETPVVLRAHHRKNDPELDKIKKNCLEFLKNRRKISPIRANNSPVESSTANEIVIIKEGDGKAQELPPIIKNPTIIFPSYADKERVIPKYKRNPKICSACFMCKPSAVPIHCSSEVERKYKTDNK